MLAGIQSKLFIICVPFDSLFDSLTVLTFSLFIFYFFYIFHFSFLFAFVFFILYACLMCLCSYIIIILNKFRLQIALTTCVFNVQRSYEKKRLWKKRKEKNKSNGMDMRLQTMKWLSTNISGKILTHWKLSCARL